MSNTTTRFTNNWRLLFEIVLVTLLVAWIMNYAQIMSVPLYIMVFAALAFGFWLMLRVLSMLTSYTTEEGS